MIKQVVVTDAWFEHEGILRLNPALQVYEHSLLKMKQVWSKTTDVTPLSWYAEQIQESPAALVASMVCQLPEGAKQFWLVA